MASLIDSTPGFTGTLRRVYPESSALRSMPPNVITRRRGVGSPAIDAADGIGRARGGGKDRSLGWRQPP
jgi:hypothetical protein